MVDKCACVWYDLVMDINTPTELWTITATGPGWTESFEVIARGRDHACYLAHTSIHNYLDLPPTADLALVDVVIDVDTCLYPEESDTLAVADNDLTWS